ncbi:hypothetical protein [Geopseudomonas aromaticivorans]
MEQDHHSKTLGWLDNPPARPNTLTELKRTRDTKTLLAFNSVSSDSNEEIAAFLQSYVGGAQK